MFLLTQTADLDPDSARIADAGRLRAGNESQVHKFLGVGQVSMGVAYCTEPPPVPLPIPALARRRRPRLKKLWQVGASRP